MIYPTAEQLAFVERPGDGGTWYVGVCEQIGEHGYGVELYGGTDKGSARRIARLMRSLNPWARVWIERDESTLNRGYGSDTVDTTRRSPVARRIGREF